MIATNRASERLASDQASKEAVRLLIILLLLLLVLATYYISVMIAGCCFPCIRRAQPRCLYSPNCRQGEFSETRI